jgi:exonuclease SbcC
MSLRFLHTTDIHFDGPNQEAALASLETLAETAERERPRVVFIAGDLFNRGVQNSGASGFPALLEVIQRILDVCPIAAVTGTPTHDLPGCYEALTRLRGGSPERNDFFLVQPGKAYGVPGLLILGCPEPSKEWFLAGTNGISADESNEKVKAGMRAILLGLGALRAEHPELPCVFIYHGAIAGATMQNGQVAEGGIAIGRDDLALVGADYYALGHIHLEQQLSGMPAYYPGPAYPVNWGEKGQVGFNLVEIPDEWPPDSQRAIVVRYDYPHPPRQKFTVDYPEPVGAELVQGIQAWICIRATKEKAKELDPESIADAYLAQGALPGSRVTVEIIPTETVRAAEITASHSLREKLCVYAEASGEEVHEAPYFTKADQLEREAAASGAAPEGLHIRIRKLRLRGAIGVWKGQHVDELELDLDRYDAGPIALVGENGSGKTTLLENMHPYSQMLTRDGPLQQHFRLRDSLRELTFTDERTGAEYRALIQIDGANASGSCEYHLFKDGEPLTDGRKKSYDDAILRLFGSLPLFLRSAFVSQRSTKSNPDLTEATKGEKKAIFRELAGLDYLQAYAENAKGKGDAIEAEISRDGAQVSLIEGQLGALPGIRADRDSRAADLEQQQRVLKGLLDTGSALKKTVEDLQAKVTAQKAELARIGGLEDQADQKRQEIITAEQLIAGYRQAVEQAPASQKIVDDWTALKEKENAETGRLGSINAERARLSGEHTTRVQAHNADVRKLEGQKAQLRTEKARLEGDRNVLQTQIDSLGAELATPLTGCPKCGFVDPKREADRQEKTQRHLDLCGKRRALEPHITAKQAEHDRIQLPAAPTAPILPPADEAELQRIRKGITGLNVEAARKNLALAQEAATRTEETRKQLEAALQARQKIDQAIAEAQAEIDDELELEHAEAQAKLEDARKEYAEAQKAVAGLEAELKGLDARILELEGQARDLEARKEKIAAAQADLADWRYLQQACGPDGIQALELDAMGPGIAEVANRLLSSAYGSRFQLEFRTTRTAGKGSKTKQVEDFSIWILDSEDGTEQELSTLSGGESVWIKRSLYDAFGIIRDRNTGTRFLTVFADEADGALDPDAKARYVTMLQQAHQESGRRHTLVITHSPEAQEMIGQRIVMSELARQEVAA